MFFLQCKESLGSKVIFFFLMYKTDPFVSPFGPWTGFHNGLILTAAWDLHFNLPKRPSLVSHNRHRFFCVYPLPEIQLVRNQPRLCVWALHQVSSSYPHLLPCLDPKAPEPNQPRPRRRLRIRSGQSSSEPSAAPFPPPCSRRRGEFGISWIAPGWRGVWRIAWPDSLFFSLSVFGGPSQGALGTAPPEDPRVTGRRRRRLCGLPPLWRAPQPARAGRGAARQGGAGGRRARQEPVRCSPHPDLVRVSWSTCNRIAEVCEAARLPWLVWSSVGVSCNVKQGHWAVAIWSFWELFKLTWPHLIPARGCGVQGNKGKAKIKEGSFFQVTTFMIVEHA